MTAPVDGVPAHLTKFLRQHSVEIEFVIPGVPAPTVSAAAEALGVATASILKTLLFAGEDHTYVIAITNGTKRVSTSRLADVVGLDRPRPAAPDVVLSLTGYSPGGVAPLGLPSHVPVVVDEAA